jgi:hypothetical protein
VITLHPDFKPVNEQAYHDIVHLHGLGEADGLARQALDASTQRQLLALKLLGIAFANLVLSRL